MNKLIIKIMHEIRPNNYFIDINDFFAVYLGALIFIYHTTYGLSIEAMRGAFDDIFPDSIQ